MFKNVQQGSTRFKKAQEGSRRLKNNQKFKKVLYSKLSIKKVNECSIISEEKGLQKGLIVN